MALISRKVEVSETKSFKYINNRKGVVLEIKTCQCFLVSSSARICQKVMEYSGGPYTVSNT